MNSTETRLSIGAAQVGIALLALGTAGIHLYLFLIEGFLGSRCRTCPWPARRSATETTPRDPPATAGARNRAPRAAPARAARRVTSSAISTP